MIDCYLTQQQDYVQRLHRSDDWILMDPRAYLCFRVCNILNNILQTLADIQRGETYPSKAFYIPVIGTKKASFQGILHKIGTALHCTVWHCTAQHFKALHCTGLHCTVSVFFSASVERYGVSRMRDFFVEPFPMKYCHRGIVCYQRSFLVWFLISVVKQLLMILY